MTVISWEEFIKGPLKGTGTAAMTIGVFDGVHLGHRQLLSDILNHHNNTSIIVTFSVNPRVYFKDKTYPGDINTQSQKLELLSSLGVDTVILIDFSYDFSKLSGKDFLYQITDNCDLEHLVLGDNFKCGDGRMTTSHEAAKILKDYNVTVDIGNMAYFEGQIVSSSRIREAVASGNFKKSQKMLERVFSLDIAGIPQIIGEKTIIIETKNIRQVLPPQGYYVVRIGNLTKTQESKICLNASEIVIPLQEMQKLDFIKFI